MKLTFQLNEGESNANIPAVNDIISGYIWEYYKIDFSLLETGIA